MFERKILIAPELKIAGKDGPGQVSGYASVFDGVDSYGDTIERGAYAETLANFLAKGFIAWGHNWSDPVAMPLEAHEDSKGLYIVGEFHGDPDAQRARTRTSERLERGLSMGLSIGYEAEEWEFRKVDTPVRDMWGEYTDKVRVLKKIKLHEVSLVTVPADDAARVDAVKAAWSQSMTFTDHVEHLRVGVRSVADRAKSLADLRTKEGRRLSEETRAIVRRATEAREPVNAAFDELDSLLQATEPAPSDEGDGKALSIGELLRIRAHLAGVAL